MVDNWVNPFSGPQVLVSVSTARAAPADVATDLMRAYNMGEEAYDSFKTDRLEDNTKPYHDRITSNKLGTFTR